MDRRSMLRWTGLALLGLMATPSQGRTSCYSTSANARGPFHLPGAPFTNKLNADDEKGRPLTVSGRVFTSTDCKPLSGAVLDIWHANTDGQYYGMEYYSSRNMEIGLLRGRIKCGQGGHYSFSTILPGYYRISPTRFRPRHIHVIISGPDGSELVTQLYFKGDIHIEGDPIAKSDLIMEVEENSTGLVANFDFYI